MREEPGCDHLADAAAETAAAAVAAAQDAAQAAREAADAATMADEEAPATAAEYSQPWPLDQIDLNASIVNATTRGTQGVDPHRAGSQNGYAMAGVFNAAMETNPADGSAIPSLAAPEWIDNVSIRASVEPAPFHDGSILTAHDIVFSYDRIGALAAYHDGGATTDHPGGWTPGNVSRSAESWVRNEALDDRTWAIELAGPTGGFFTTNLATTSEVAIVSQADVEARGDAAVDTVPMGTGPYRFVSSTADENTVLERFEDHFVPVDYPIVGPHYAHNKHLTVLVRPEIQSQLAGLEAGEIDMVRGLGPDIVAPYQDDPDFTVQFEPVGNPPLINMYINTYAEALDDGSPNPFRDLRVRQAANHAINRQAIIDNLLLGRGRQSLFGFRNIQGYPTGEQKRELDFDYDPERARALLAEAGVADGFDIRLYWPADWGSTTFPDMVLAVAQDLNAVGIRAEPVSVPVGEYYTDAYTRGRENAPPGLFWFGANHVVDVSSMWDCCVGPDGFFNLAPPDPALDELYQALKVEPDAERRTAMVTELFQEHTRGAYQVFLVELEGAALTAADVNWPVGGPFGRLKEATTCTVQRRKA